MGSRARAFLVLAMCLIAIVGGCHSAQPKVSGPLIQWGYLWQRDWTSAVTEAMQEAEKHLDGVVVLGAEIVWDDGKARAMKANIPWEVLKKSGKPCALAVRIAPYPGPFSKNDEHVQAIVAVVKSLLDEARAHEVVLSEFQIDFDCAQKKLTGYHDWLQVLVPVIHPTRVAITTLPAWLDEPEFPKLVGEADGYVLQVHSVPTLEESGKDSLCDPVLARKWVTKAANLGIPFSVALPTYRCLAGYDRSGKLLDVAMDSVDPSWPPGTHLLEFATNADDMADLVKEWTAERPAVLRELLWYRLPVATDLRNWRWATLSAVMEGRKPAHRLDVIQNEINPVDLSITNAGEAEEHVNCDVVVRWTGSGLVASDALPGWAVSTEKEMATFSSQKGYRLSLPPGGRVGLGWLRFDKPTVLRMEVVPHDETPR